MSKYSIHTEKDVDGDWQVKVNRDSGVRTRILTKPTQAYIDKQATDKQVSDAIADDEEATKLTFEDKIKKATTIATLRECVLSVAKGIGMATLVLACITGCRSAGTVRISVERCSTVSINQTDLKQDVDQKAGKEIARQATASIPIGR